MEMLQLILDRCGNGKTEKLREFLKQELNSGNNKIILLVPEQSSFGNEKNLLDLLGNRAFNKIKVLSFSRIPDFISQTLNIPPFTPPSDCIKNILVNIAIENTKSKLKLYIKNSDNTEITNIMIKTMQMFKDNQITTDKLEEMIGKVTQQNLKQKITECKLVIETFESLAKEKFQNFPNNFEILEIIRNNNIFSNYSIFIDEFSSFTPHQYAILELMLKQAKDVYITLCSDMVETDDFSLFSCTQKTIKILKNIAKKHDIEIYKPLLLDKTTRFRNLELSLLEKNIFEPQKNSFEHAPKNIHIYSANDIYDECENVARIIRKLVIENGHQYKNFTIITRDIEQYGDICKNILKKYDIPCFVDTPEKVFNKNLVNLVLAAFDIIHFNYTSNDIFRFLKTGLTEFNIEEISLIENYALMWDIKGAQWLDNFTMHPSGFSEKFDEKDEQLLVHLKELRYQIISPLQNFKKNISRTTGDEIAKAVYILLEEINTAENLCTLCGKLIQENKPHLAEQQSKLWDILMDTLNDTAVLLKGQYMTSKKYLEVLISALDCADLSFIPQSLDDVVIASISRIRLADPKIVFIVGAVNGEFPMVPVQSEFFTDTEIKSLASLGFQLCDNTEDYLLKERFLAYTAIASPSQRLYVSWPALNKTGKGKLPSEIIKEIKSVFPNLKIKDSMSTNDEDCLFAEKPAFEFCAKNWRQSSILENTLKEYFQKNETYKEKFAAIERASQKQLMNFKTAENSKNLFSFGKNLRISASQVERYHTCRFSYFCEYGLQAKSRKPAKFGALEYGNLVHFFLEKLFKKYPGKKFKNLSNENIKLEIKTLIDKYVSERLGGWENKPQRFKYLFSKCEKAFEFLAMHLIEELNQSEFSPVDSEIEISRKGQIKPLGIKLPDGTIAEIEGKVDRVDIMQKNGKNFIRIIDYKTGIKEFKLSDILHGLNMQMLIYLAAICKNGNSTYGDVIPAGVLYLPSVKPIIDFESTKNSPDFDLKIKKKIRMNGLILNNIEVITGMEKEGQGLFIPVSLKNGEVKKSESLMNLEQLGIITNHIEKSVSEMAQCLKQGEVSANPISKTHKACDWCDYKPICRYEDDEFIEIPEMSNEETLSRMGGETNA